MRGAFEGEKDGTDGETIQVCVAHNSRGVLSASVEEGADRY